MRCYLYAKNVTSVLCRLLADMGMHDFISDFIFCTVDKSYKLTIFNHCLSIHPNQHWVYSWQTAWCAVPLTRIIRYDTQFLCNCLFTLINRNILMRCQSPSLWPTDSVWPVWSVQSEKDCLQFKYNSWEQSEISREIYDDTRRNVLHVCG